VLNLKELLTMSTTSIGRQAEQKAADYLSKKYGYQLLAKNWRTRTCEIDLIMQKGDVVHFVEVKFRRNNFAGGGIASISPQKVKKMYSAAQEWLDQNCSQENLSPNLSAIELTGPSLKITGFIESIEVDFPKLNF
jgi:uncharacterized protein (TIGR00252 family)